jgi:autotransporter translocation and assembly factor TamB
MSNLTYLIDRDWVKVIEVEKTIQVKGGTIPSTVTWYEIAAPGIDKIEGESEFQPRERYAGINITATGSNVITLGDGNVVNAQFKELHSALDKLKNEITRTGKLAESTKLDLSVDIESIKDQLAKEHPDKTMIGHLWSGVERIVNGAGLIELIYKVAPLIAGLLPK